MGGLGFDSLGGRRGNRTLAHGLDCGGGRGSQGGVGGPRLGGHAHHLLLMLEVILQRKTSNNKLAFSFISLVIFGADGATLHFVGIKTENEAAMTGQ